MFHALPQQVHDLLSSDAFKGGPIIMLDSVLQSPRKKHIKQNRFWLHALYMDHCGQLKETARAVMNMNIPWLW